MKRLNKKVGPGNIGILVNHSLARFDPGIEPFRPMRGKRGNIGGLGLFRQVAKQPGSPIVENNGQTSNFQLVAPPPAERTVE